MTTIRSSYAPRIRPVARPTVLAVTFLDGASVVALVRAAELARALDAELVVLYAITTDWASDLGALMSAQILGAARTIARAWCEDVLGDWRPSPSVVVGHGDVLETVGRVADDCDAGLIVLGDHAHPGAVDFDGAATAVTFVRQAGRPALVARVRGALRGIVAATDFSDESFPALRHAARLGAKTHVPITFLHNTQTTHPDGRARYEDDLRRLAGIVGLDAESVVTERPDHADAIVGVASERHADLIIVGARLRDRTKPLGTATRVARNAPQSVLVVPLAP